MHRFAGLALLGIALIGGGPAAAVEGPPLRLSAKIPLGDVIGRIDHLAIDLGRKRLFVAELGNDSVGVIDLKKGQVIRHLSGLKAPQGVAYEPSTDTLYVTNAGDGSVRFFQGTELRSSGRIDLGEDADNIRVDAERHRVLVGYGNGAIATIDPRTRAKTSVVILDGHPEGLQTDGTRIFANVPDGRYQLQVWFERSSPEELNNLARVVTISSVPSSRSLETIRVVDDPNFTLSHKNKYGEDYVPPPSSGYSAP